MTRFDVSWTDDAEQDLAAFWLAVSDRQAITAAEARLTDLLSRDPLTCGAALAEGLRCLTEPPLVVVYSVDVSKRKVEVSGVGLTS